MLELAKSTSGQAVTRPMPLGWYGEAPAGETAWLELDFGLQKPHGASTSGTR
jgi:hypothetical protein